MAKGSCERDNGTDSQDLYVSWLLLVCVILFQMYLCSIFRQAGLSLDEAGGWWVSQGSALEVIAKSIKIQGQTPLYYLLQSSALKHFGDTEASLRLISHLSIILTTLAMFFLTRGFLSPLAALAATVGLGLNREYLEIAFVARPYSAALLVCVVLLTSSLRSLQCDAPRSALYLGILCSLLVYLHFIFIPFIAALLIGRMLVRQLDRGSRVFAVLALLSFAVSLLPAIPQLLMLLGRSQELSWAALPPLEVTICVTLGILVVMALITSHVRRYGKDHLLSYLEGPRAKPIVFTSLALLGQPITLLYAGSLGGLALLVPRYYSCAYVALAILVGQLVNSRTRRTQRFLVTGILIFSLARMGTFNWPGEGFKEAAYRIQQQGNALPILFSSGFIEAKNRRYLEDPDYVRFFQAPLLFYLDSTEIRTLPLSLDEDEGKVVVQELMGKRSQDSGGFWLAARSNVPATDIEILKSSAALEGCIIVTQHAQLSLSLWRYTCDARS